MGMALKNRNNSLSKTIQPGKFSMYIVKRKAGQERQGRPRPEGAKSGGTEGQEVRDAEGIVRQERRREHRDAKTQRRRERPAAR